MDYRFSQTLEWVMAPTECTCIKQLDVGVLESYKGWPWSRLMFQQDILNVPCNSVLFHFETVWIDHSTILFRYIHLFSILISIHLDLDIHNSNKNIHLVFFAIIFSISLFSNKIINYRYDIFIKKIKKKRLNCSNHYKDFKSFYQTYLPVQHPDKQLRSICKSQ